MTNYHDPKYGWPTTRCYPRTMMQAFQQDQGEWWFPPEQSTTQKVWLYASITFFLSTLIYLLETI